MKLYSRLPTSAFPPSTEYQLYLKAGTHTDTDTHTDTHTHTQRYIDKFAIYQTVL